MIYTEKRSARFGDAILIFALLLRLLVGIVVSKVWAEEPQTVFRPHRPAGGVSLGPVLPTQTVPPVTTMPPSTVEPTVPTMPTVPAATVPVIPKITFSQGDMGYVKVRYGTDCGYRAELEALLLRPLDWQLNSDEPTVLIVHSHATESFTRQPGQDYKETSEYRTRDTDYNMVAVGDLLAQQLRQLGIGVVHDRQLHDDPSYSSAYANSRKSVEQYLQEYPSIRLVLDLHRDAALNADGSQYATSATIDGQQAAQIMLLAGTDWKGGSHPGWQENLALALKLQVLLEQAHPGITRRTLVRGSIFNQDLCGGMLIVEMGTAGNTLQETLRAVPPLAKAIAALANGAEGG